MSLYTNRSTRSLLNMTEEMFRKEIELGRIVKTSALLTLSGVSPCHIDKKIIQACLDSQMNDGGFIGNTDTIWSICLLQQVGCYSRQIDAALKWVQNNSDEHGGFGRTVRDMHRIPVTGLALSFVPQLAEDRHLRWMEHTWSKEMYSLTYKAAYTLMAFSKNKYSPENQSLIKQTDEWLISQQEENGGFAPWLNHPVGPNIYCTAIATLGLMSYGENEHFTQIQRAYGYMKETQLKNGIWPYHEIEDGASWGLYAMSKAEEYFWRQP